MPRLRRVITAYRFWFAKSKIAAQLFAKQSGRLADVAARELVQNLLESGLLLDAEESNELQKIQFVGHSRGAAVNARATRLLSGEGYRNIAYYAALDGFSRDWPIGGVIGDLARVNVDADEKVNYRVQ